MAKKMRLSPQPLTRSAFDEAIHRLVGVPKAEVDANESKYRKDVTEPTR